MCGIAGQIVIRKQEHNIALDADAIKKALHSMQSRGPDHSGLAAFEHCILGHNRLRILDVSENADQPMSDPEGRYTIVFNGEIFNYRELRRDLENRGIRFRTTSDTEVLLHLLIEKGESALPLFNGFFAFAFFDRQEHKMLLARDRYGEKPLWYSLIDQRFSFASNLIALLRLQPAHEIDHVSLQLLFQYSYIPGPHTILRNVYKLLPGHLIRINQDAAETVKWHYPDRPAITENYADACESLRSLMEDAVRMRMQADVPLGCFLSGGLDSSIISSIAVRQNSALKTFSIAFPDTPFLDESAYARKVAEAIGSKHETVEVRTHEMTQEVIDIIQTLDEPFADSSSIAVSILSGKVKKHFTVALSGDGSDEIFGGYHKYRALLRSTEECFTDKILLLAEPIAEILPKGRSNPLANAARKLHKYNKGIQLSFRDRYLYWSSWTDETICEKLIARDVILRLGARVNAFVQDVDPSNFNSVLLADQNLVLAHDMLVKVDSMSMKHALEVRSPFLDHRVVDFANALPVDWKVNPKQGKKILSGTFQKDLPHEILNRKKKGFEVPLEKWLRTDIKPFVLDTLQSPLSARDGHISAKVLASILEDFYKRNNNRYTYLIYAVLVFESWYRRLRALA